MSAEMGSFRVDVEIENPLRPGERRVVYAALVDAGAERSWFPAGVLESLGIERLKRTRFRQADGTVLERATGRADVHLAGTWAVDEVVFAEPGALVLLGWRVARGYDPKSRPGKQASRRRGAGARRGRRHRSLVIGHRSSVIG